MIHVSKLDSQKESKAIRELEIDDQSNYQLQTSVDNSIIVEDGLEVQNLDVQVRLETAPEVGAAASSKTTKKKANNDGLENLRKVAKKLFLNKDSSSSNLPDSSETQS